MGMHSVKRDIEEKQSIVTVKGVLSTLFFAGFIAAIMAVAAKAEEPGEISCKKLYVMQDTKDGSVFKKELNKRCNALAIHKLEQLHKEYAVADRDRKNEIIKETIKLENELEKK